MTNPSITPLIPDHLAALAALANGIIPADEIDAGAAEVSAAARLDEKIQNGVNAAIYQQGLATAATLAQEKHGRPLAKLTPAEIHELIATLRDRLPAFFKQLRLDVSALYLSDPGVWQRIGFPGPSTATGGYPDFDQPQTNMVPRQKGATVATNESLKLGPIDQIGLSCTDLDEAERFYSDVLGLRLSGDVPGTMKFFTCDRMNIVLFKGDSVPPNSVIYFRVQGEPGLIEKKAALLKSSGVKVESDPHVIARNWNGFDVWLAFFRDPFGNLLALKSDVPTKKMG
ncbi:MAG TPA: gluconate 2-dehydrogenase subunit 3 family protein [Pirellulales bacterium]|jgi:catechol 2,3-dioxygenase-like lactoylglutathione lyase family enzyme|nr:gluconate 2-dehydrogenase subunit 3 family protein [Pirellulales bacterium]